MRRYLFLTLVLLTASTGTLRADDFERFKLTTRLFAEISSFYWDEHENGGKLLDEEGYLYALGASVSDICGAAKSFRPDWYRLTYGGKAQYRFGTVNYDGRTTGANPVPVQTDVDYSGFTFEGYLGAIFKTAGPGWFVEPKWMLGYRNWTRDLQSNSVARGYKENWQTLYSRMGVTVTWLFAKACRLNFSGGATVPLWAANDVHLLGYDIGVEPESFLAAPFAEAAFEYQRFGLAFYYEAFRFGRSKDAIIDVAEEEGPIRYVHQPESFEERIGIRLMVAFF